MSTLWDVVIPFLIYWLLIYVACYLVSEFGQNYLYDEVVKGLGWRVALGSVVLAGILSWAQSNLDTMFTEQVGSTILQALAWAAIFILLYRFQPLHGAAIGVGVMVITIGLASLAVGSLQASGRPRLEPRAPSKAVRRAGGGPPSVMAPGAAAKVPSKTEEAAPAP